MDSAGDLKQKKAPRPPPAGSQLKTDVYALDVASGKTTLLTQIEGQIDIVAAPVGAQMVLVRWDRTHKSALYNGVRKLADLPIATGLCVWSADASTIYFDDGPAELLGSLGVLRLDGLTVSHRELFAPAEYVFVCPATGHVFTGLDLIPNAEGSLQGTTAVEYDGI